MIRGQGQERRRGRPRPRPQAENRGRRRGRADAPKPASPPPRRRSRRPRPGPASSGSANAGSTELEARINAKFGDGDGHDHHGRLARPEPIKLVAVCLYLRDENPIRYDYLVSLQSVHFEDCIEVNYHLDSTDTRASLDRAPRADGRGRRPWSRRSSRSGAGPISRSARSTT